MSSETLGMKAAKKLADRGLLRFSTAYDAIKEAAPIINSEVRYDEQLRQMLVDLFDDFLIEPHLSNEDLQQMACGDAFIRRKDTASIKYIGKTPYRDNAHGIVERLANIRGML